MKQEINKTELRSIVKEYEETDIRRSATVADLLAIMEDTKSVDSFVCPLIQKKAAMEDYIQSNMRAMRTQLPECTGKCTTFGCPDGVVVNCYLQLKPLLEK